MTNELTPLLLVSAMLLLSMGGTGFVLLTTFLKFSVVLNVLKMSMGLQQSPPNMVLNALAALFTLHTMMPVFTAMYDKVAGDARIANIQKVSLTDGWDLVQQASMPLRQFMAGNTSPELVTRYEQEQAKVPTLGQAHGQAQGPAQAQAHPATRGFLADAILFVCSELTAALKIAVVLYLTFLVVDFFVGAILQVIGMQQMQIASVATPIKFLLVASSDGIYRLLTAVSLSYNVVVP